MRTRRRLAPLLVAPILGACVSLEEAPLPRGAVSPGQRTVLLVYSSPGPVITELDSKAETAAMILPGLGLLVQSAHDDRDLAASRDLQQYLPAWDPAGKFHPLLARELATTGHPGRFIGAEEAGLSPAELSGWNKAEHYLDWRRRYFQENPELPAPRDYSKNLSLDDALIFEVDLAHGVERDGEGNAAPNLSAAVRLLRASTLRTLWRREMAVEDKAGARTLYDFKVEPDDLIAKWEKLMPALAGKIAAALRENLKAEGPPAPAAAAAAVSTAAAPAVAVSTSAAAPAAPPEVGISTAAAR